MGGALGGVHVNSQVRGSQAACRELVCCMLLSLYFQVTCNPSRVVRGVHIDPQARTPEPLNRILSLTSDRSGVCTSILRRAPFLGRDGLPRGVGHSDSELEKVTALRVLRQVASPPP